MRQPGEPHCAFVRFRMNDVRFALCTGQILYLPAAHSVKPPGYRGIGIRQRFQKASTGNQL
jgi:hypothetical protein